MANIASARKRARQAEKRRLHNAALRSELRSAIREVRKAITAGDKKSARAVYQRAVGVIVLRYESRRPVEIPDTVTSSEFRSKMKRSVRLKLSRRECW